MRPPIAALLALLSLAAGPLPGPAAAQDGGGKGKEENPFGEEAPPPLTPEEEKEAAALFAKAKAETAKGAAGFLAARKLYQEFLKKYPGGDEDMLIEAEDRSGENCLANIELMHDGGPSPRRIDVELMGDGYTVNKYQEFLKHAPSQMVEFWREPLYAEYEDYFNVWRFDLVSKEEGVDELSMEERMGAPPPPPEPARPGRKKKREPKKFSTALNCIAAGPQNQVWADPEQVQRWRRYLPESDGLTIAFAKKGELGMGGGGIATTGRKVAVVHEFGHAFVGLLDEYAVNPMRPQGRIFAANAVSTNDDDPRTPPPVDDIPWKHWLKAKHPDVKVLLGGATYQTGVFRPAASCAMNSGGSGNMCWVCREEGVLKIYSYVNPVDEYGPVQDVISMTPAESREFFVVPMAPKRHRLLVEWYLQRISTGEPLPPEPAAPEEGGEVSSVADDRASGMWRGDGDRGFRRRQDPLPEGKPLGSTLKAVERKLKDNAFRSSVVLKGLDPGTWKVTARVLDDAKVPGYGFPWVLKDDDRMREEWKTWRVDVTGGAAVVPAPGPGNPPGR